MSDGAREFVFTTGQRQPVGRTLDQMDRAIARAGRAIWRFLVDGFAAHGAAECGMLIERRCDYVCEKERGLSPVVVARSSFGAIDPDDLQGEFDTLDDLIRSLQTVSE